MGSIRNRLFKDYPYTKELLLSLKIIDAANITLDADIVKSYSKIVESKYIGNQYIWLASFAKQYGIKLLEMGIEVDGNTNAVVKPFVQKSSNTFLFEDKYPSLPEYNLFKYFSFPILEHSKKDMTEISEKENWTDIMKMTWFCHRPYLGKFPCGSCNPCVSAYEDGMGWRIPLFFRIFGRSFKKVFNSKLIRTLR